MDAIIRPSAELRNFKSDFFRDDENGDELSVYVQSPDLTECSEKCVEAFNNFTASEINEISRSSYRT